MSITQVSENVIFLALGLIYRLKSPNWKIGGQNVSEFVVMSVALMLSNKCELYGFNNPRVSIYQTPCY